jgi:hypothetical protein
VPGVTKVNRDGNGVDSDVDRPEFGAVVVAAAADSLGNLPREV